MQYTEDNYKVFPYAKKRTNVIEARISQNSNLLFIYLLIIMHRKLVKTRGYCSLFKDDRPAHKLVTLYYHQLT